MLECWSRTVTYKLVNLFAYLIFSNGGGLKSVLPTQVFFICGQFNVGQRKGILVKPILDCFFTFSRKQTEHKLKIKSF
jgi:hypothetical protein